MMEFEKIVELAESVAKVMRKIYPISKDKEAIEEEVLEALAFLREECNTYCEKYDEYLA
jgi:hypothetical protein